MLVLSNRFFALVAIAAFAAFPQSSSALNLGQLLKQVVEGSGQDGQQAATGNGSAGSSQATNQAPGKNAGGSFGSALTDRYCRQMFSMAGLGQKIAIDQSLVLDEFKLAAPGDFYDAYLAAASKPGYAFPYPRFYQGEFETDRINVLYDLLLSYPSPQYLAALITEARKQSGSPQYDHQMKVDAVAALTVLHYYLSDRSKNPDRWKELALQLQGEEHYTARVITARLLASGELGAKDPGRALTYAGEANGLRQKYITEQGYRTMSQRNYAITSNRTLYEVTTANSRMPQAQYYIQFAQQYAATLKNPIVAPELETRLGPTLRTIEQSAASAARKASAMLDSARTGALLKAEKGSLDNAMRNRVSDAPSEINIDEKTMLSVTRELEKLKRLDEKQKQQFASALVDAHDSGDKAIAMMPVMMTSMMNLMMQRGIAAMPAMVPYAKKLQYYSDNACSVISRWDQAAMVTQSTEDNSRNGLAALVNGTD